MVYEIGEKRIHGFVVWSDELIKTPYFITNILAGKKNVFKAYIFALEMLYLLITQSNILSYTNLQLFFIFYLTKAWRWIATSKENDAIEIDGNFFLIDTQFYYGCEGRGFVYSRFFVSSHALDQFFAYEFSLGLPR